MCIRDMFIIDLTFLNLVSLYPVLAIICEIQTRAHIVRHTYVHTLVMRSVMQRLDCGYVTGMEY